MQSLIKLQALLFTAVIIAIFELVVMAPGASEI